MDIINKTSNPIIIGCNYHTKWQAKKSMRFVLKEVKGDKARLVTMITKKDFWTDLKDLVFIHSRHNSDKAQKILNDKSIPISKLNNKATS